MLRRYLGVIIPAIIITLWEFVWHFPDVRLESISRPVDILAAMLLGLKDGSIISLTLQTFEGALLGFLIATLIGVSVGVMLGLMPTVERVVGPSLDALRPIPSVALIPLALMIFGFGVRMEASIVAFACVWPVLIVTTAAIRGLDKELLNVARVLEMNLFDRLLKIILPGALGRIAVGLQVALAISLVVAVTVEIVLNPRGLGHAMIAAQQALQYDRMYALLLWLGLMGWALSYFSQAALLRSSVAYRLEQKGGAR